jgi:hypothetical protein
MVVLTFAVFSQSMTESPQFKHYLDNTLRKSTVSILGQLPYDGIGKDFLISEMPNTITTGYLVQQISNGLYQPLYGNVSANQIGAGFPMELKIQGSRHGEWNGRLRSNLEAKKFNFQTIVDGYRYQGNLDANADGFRDLEQKDRLIASHAINYIGKKWNTNIKFHYINSESIGGVLDFDKSTDYLTQNQYGYGQEVENWGVHWNSTFNLGKSQRSKRQFIKLQVNGMQHQHNGFYGLRNLQGTEDFLESRLFYSRNRPFGNFQIGLAHRYQNIHQEAFRQITNLLDNDILINRWSVFGARHLYFGHNSQMKGFVRLDYEDGKIEAFPRFQIDFRVHPKSDWFRTRQHIGHWSFFVAREKRLALHFFENEHLLNSYRTFEWQTFDNKYDKGWTGGMAFKSKAFNFEFPGMWVESTIPASQILWRTIWLDEHTETIFNDSPDTTRARLQFERTNKLEFQHLFEIATGLNIERMIGRVLLRWNMPSNGRDYLIPRTTLVLQAGYNATFGIGTVLTWYHQGKQYLYDGTFSPRNNRWDWRFYFQLNQAWQNYFTENSTFYFGFNNMGSRRQEDTVISPENPFSSQFDATQIWGNTIGSQFYFGYKLRVF